MWQISHFALATKTHGVRGEATFACCTCFSIVNRMRAAALERLEDFRDSRVVEGGVNGGKPTVKAEFDRLQEIRRDVSTSFVMSYSKNMEWTASQC